MNNHLAANDILEVRTAPVRQQVDYTRYYNRWNDDSDAHWETMLRQESKWISEVLPQDRHLRALDLGCGRGFLVAALMRMGFTRVEGIDADPGQIRIARERKVPAHFVETTATLEWMAQRKANYDLVTAIDVVEHIPLDQQIAFIRGTYEMLAPGGTFICRVPNANASLHGTWRWGDWTHTCAFTEASLDFVLFNGGFCDIKVQEADPFRFEFSRFYRPRQLLRASFRLLRRLEYIAEFGLERGRSIPLSLNILGIARKAA